MTAKQLAQVLHGTVEGDPNARVTTFAKIEHGKPGALSFYANPKYEQYVYTSKSSILLVNTDFEPKQAVTPTLVRVPDAYKALADLLNHVASEKKKYRRHRSFFSRIACSAKLGSKVSVGQFTFIGKKAVIGSYTIIHHNVTIGHDVQIGNHCIIYPGVRIYPGTKIGNNVILHENCVIGSDGFGNVKREDGTWEKIEHLGNVIIGDDVEIGTGTTVDRAPMESTIIESGVRIDNLCQIAHNVVIGENTAIAAQAGIAGSTIVGKNCIIAGQAGLVGHIKIADDTVILAQAGVTSNVRKPGTMILGSPAIDRANYMRSYIKFKQAGLSEE